jgi:thioredoxin
VGAAPAEGPIHLSDAAVPIEVDRSPIPVLIDLWAPWCGPCRMIAPIIEQLAAELAGRVKVTKLNVDENPEAAARFRAHSIPTLVLVSKGREVDRLIGLHPKLEIERWLEERLSHVH